MSIVNSFLSQVEIVQFAANMLPRAPLTIDYTKKSEAYKDTPDEVVENELRAYTKDKLAPYKVPKIYEFLNELPLTSVGKIDKKKLREA